MANVMPSVTQQIGRLFAEGTLTGLSDAELLGRFASGRDPLAFDALVERHGPMVLCVCRGLLDDPNDAEDAFQATFLILVKKAGTFRVPSSEAPVGKNWNFLDASPTDRQTVLRRQKDQVESASL